MWMEKTKTGYAFRETYVEPLTGKRKKVSVTMPSKSNMAKKAAAEKLQLMIQEKTHCHGTNVLLFDIIQSYINSRQGFVKTLLFSAIRWYKNGCMNTSRKIPRYS